MKPMPFVVSDTESNLEYIRLADPIRIPEYMSRIQELEANLQAQEKTVDKEFIKRHVLRDSVKEAFEKSGIPVLVEDSFYSQNSLVCVLRHYYSNEHDITIDGKYEVIESGCFEHCPHIETLCFEEGVEQINGSLFASNRLLKHIEFPYSLRSIGSLAFHACSALETVIFTNPNTHINPSAFEGTKWFEAMTDEFVVVNKQLLKYQGESDVLALPDGIEIVGSQVFHGNLRVQKLICPLSLREIGTFAFADCPRLSFVDFNEGLELVGIGAFEDCPDLSRVTLPGSLQEIGCEAFSRRILLHYSSQNISLAKHIKETYPNAVCISGPLLNEQTTDVLYEMCNHPVIDFSTVENFITEQHMTPEDITYVATRLTENNTNEITEFEYQNEYTPYPYDLATYSWVPLFEMFAKYGLQPNTIIRDGRNYMNMMFNLRYVQNKGIAPAVMRIMMECGGDPNLEVDRERFFDDLMFSIDFDVVELNNKELFDTEFRVWLVAMAYGGHCANGQLPIDLKEGYAVEVFKDYERFDYQIEFLEKDWIMHIIDIESGNEVATM